MSLEANKKVVVDFFGAISARDARRLSELMHANFQWWIIGTLPFSGTKDGAAFKGAVQMLWDVIEGPVALHVDQLTAEDDRVALIAHGKMVTKTGMRYDNTYNLLLTVKDGKIIGGREYFDTQLVAKAFGF